MDRCKRKAKRRLRRRRRIRRTLIGTGDRPRLSVFRSARHISVQVIDDDQGRTLAACSTLEKGIRSGLKTTGNASAAEAVGKELARRAITAGITKVAFDRGGYRYHGRVKALAEAARKEGLKF